MKFKITFLCFSLLIWLEPVLSASNYWQNEVRYEIHVALNDSDHTLSGWQITRFINNSPDRLKELYILLMPNAYRDTSTAFARQQKKFYQTRFLFANEKDRGWIKVSECRVNDRPVKLLYDLGSPDLARIKLTEPLNPGDALQIYFKWQLKYPGGFSRMNHHKQHYETTQWYPKLAVYDKHGWHPYPYLDAGEFYGEFGTYDVFITLPENYVVAATGDLMTLSEIAWRDSLARIGNDFFQKPRKERDKLIKKWKKDKNRYRSSTKLKTVHFHQEKVHDFAWFADKRYIIQKGEYYLPDSNRKVELWSYTLPENHQAWKRSIEYIHDALYYYGKWYGQYPYNQVSAVDGAIEAGGGMEYPNITVCRSTKMQPIMEMLIVHEVGHNWFYGILGTDERRSAWMDEGINSFSESRYFREKYGNDFSFLTAPPPFNLFTRNIHHDFMFWSGYWRNLEYRWDLPCTWEAQKYPTSGLYGNSVYSKPALIFRALQSYLGDQKFDKAMQTYYQKWKYKHPELEDVRTIFEQVAGEDLSWAFDDLLSDTKYVDYEIEKVRIAQVKNGYKTSVRIENEGNCLAPVYLVAYKNDKIIFNKWIRPKSRELTVTLLTPEKPDQIVIDPDRTIPERNYLNNYYHKKIEIIPFFKPEQKNSFLIVANPYIWYDRMDGLKLGAVFFRGFSAEMPHNLGLSLAYSLKISKFVWGTSYLYKHAFSSSSSLKWETRLNDVIGKRQFLTNLQLSTYPPYMELQNTNTLGIMFDYEDLYRSEYFDPLYWSRNQKSLNLQLDFSKKNRGLIWNSLTRVTFRQGINYFNYSKVKLYFSYNRRLSRKLSSNLELFAGYVQGKAPLQELFYGAGSIDPIFRSRAVFDRTGESIWSPGNNFYLPGESNLLGYTHLRQGKRALTGKLELKYRRQFLLFLTAGDIPTKTFNDFQLNFSWGLGVDFTYVKIYLPLFLNNPDWDDIQWINRDNFKHRFLFSIIIPTNFSFGR